MDKQVTMELAKATKGTFVYEAKTVPGQSAPVCRSVYLSKDALPSTPPPTITLTVTWSA